MATIEIESFFNQGAAVRVNVCEESPISTFYGVPHWLHGSMGVIIDFARTSFDRHNKLGLKPGIYLDRSSAEVMLDNGMRLFMPTPALETLTGEQVTRIDWPIEVDFVREPPETPFWEGDIVKSRKSAKLFQVVSIRYHGLGKYTTDNQPWPIYSLAGVNEDSHSICSANDIELVERGPIWREHHQ